ncbi:hypothetical protein HDU85_005532 [Gaertneriomyces sp. JEL0708]|nr:hypothetical protein HDU85_005532 [Gaertneriomyces sp. JEL0708]
MQRGEGARYTFADDDAYAGFEKNFAEVQKLLERAKYLDERGYNNPSVAAADVEKKRRRVENFTRSNQQAHQQMLELMSDNKSLAGRKPIRVIAAELSKRIETLKSNQTEWESFQARILEYRATDAKNTRGVTLDAVQQNKQNVRHLRPEVRRQTRKELAAEHDHHREEVFNRKREQDLFLWRERVASLRKKEADLGQSKKPEEQLGRAQTLQKKWLIITSVASRLAMMRIVLEASRAERSERARRNRAARVIQKAYRRHKSLRQERKRREALTTIAVVFRIYIRRRRERMKHSASNTIRQFFRDVYDVSKLMKVVKKYRFSVVKCQSYVRSWRTIIDCQVEVLCRYWDKLEPLWWAQRKQNAGARASSAVEVDDKRDKKKEKVDKSKGAKTKGKSRKDESSDKVFLKVADTTKRALLREDLLARRKQHRKQVKQFEQDSLGDLKSETTISSQPKRPVFKLLPSQSDMYSLIERGHLTAY